MPRIACAGVGNELQVCIRKPDGFFFHAVRRVDGSWDGFNDASIVPNSGDVTQITCAGVGNELHVCLRKNNGAFFHAIRLADGSWNGFNDGFFTLAHFTFDGGISGDQRNTLLERHRFALSRIAGCGNLNDTERQSLTQAYQRAIAHGIETRPNVNASAIVGGSQLWVNFGVLFPQGQVETAQTLIHEMMHCADFTHPTRRDPPAGMSCAAPNPAIFDCPFDNGQYYGTPPLRAEICIAGNQSDMLLRVREKAGEDHCVIDEQGVASIHRG